MLQTTNTLRFGARLHTVAAMVVCSKLQIVACFLAVSLASHALAHNEPSDALYLSACQNNALGQEVPSQPCQGAGAPEQNDEADKEKRKQYIKDVLSKSKVQGKRLVLSGSGFFVSEDGALITNHRLVRECAQVSISPIVGDMVLADTIVHDATTDLALLRGKLVPPAVANLIDSEGTLKREPVYVVGYPDPGPTTSMPALTPVEVLGSQRTAFNVSTILLRGDVRSGNNGGPLLDSGGGVVGAIIASQYQTYAGTAISSAVGMAVPSEVLRKFLDSHKIDYRIGLELPPKPVDRLLVDGRRFMAQIGCWQ